MRARVAAMAVAVAVAMAPFDSGLAAARPTLRANGGGKGGSSTGSGSGSGSGTASVPGSGSGSGSGTASVPGSGFASGSASTSGSGSGSGTASVPGSGSGSGSGTASVPGSGFASGSASTSGSGSGSASGTAAVPGSASDSGSGANESDASAAFAAASKRLLAGDLAGARAGYEAVVALEPQGAWAAQALLEAGAVAERQGDLAGARVLYRRVLAEHARHRASRLAEARLAALAEAGGPEGRWDAVAAEHERIVRGASADEAGARAAMAALLQRSPGYPRWVPAAIWLADGAVRANDYLQAAVWYRRARIAATTPAERFRAGMGEGGGWRVIGELDRARETYASLEPPDEIAAGARAQALAAIDRSLEQKAWAWVARAALVVAFVLAVAALWRRRGSWRGAARALWPPPLEVAYLVPVGAAFMFVAASGNPVAARAAETILVGAIVIGWLSGAVLRAGPGRTWSRALHVLVVIAATAAVIYLTVTRAGLIDLLIETWRSGHDGR